MALDCGLSAAGQTVPLPCDEADGARTWPEAGVTQIALGPWRASITVNDIPSTRKRGGHPSGGALSMLWHARTGPLCVASLNDYIRYEGINMDDAPADADRAVLTPRIEVRRGDRIYSNLYDGKAELSHREIKDGLEVTAKGTLRNSDGGPLPEKSAFELRYTFTSDAVVLSARTEAAARFIVPIASPAAEPFTASGDREFEWRKPDACVRLAASHAPIPPPGTVRIFNYVPGIQATPVILATGGERSATVRIVVEV